MAKSLVIVESPAKAKTINKYLGSSYTVKSSVGHVRDLPTSASRHKGQRTASKPIPRNLPAEDKQALREEREHKRLIRNMGIDPENGWTAQYEILPGKTKVVEDLKRLAEQADTIYLATDLDREGEAIAWHLMQSIGGDPQRFQRVTFSEITKNAIQRAFETPGRLNMDRVNAQQARRFLDRVVGYMISPLLWKKVARGLSAGRVQSVAVRLIVEREREIRAFVPEEYWKLFARLQGESSDEFRAQVSKVKGKTFRPGTEDEVNKAIAELRPAEFEVTDRKDRPTKQRPNAPFITTTLQQAASVRLGYGVKKTMLMAQRLYEAGLITYMRTDSTQLSPQAVQACRTFISDTFDDRYLPDKPPFYASKESAQEAHEAIRPTQVDRVPDQLSKLERDQYRLYDLIWRQFVASQMSPAEFDSTRMTITAGAYELRASGRVMRFDGWMKVLPPVQKKGDDSNVKLPDVKVGEKLTLLDLDPSQHFTKPPPRYTEASLVKELEKRGIGRPSTYASIISTIQDRGYVELVKRRFYAQKIGDIVTDRLVENFNDLMDYGFTASLEEDLDRIAQGNTEWKAILDAFYEELKTQLREAEHQMRPNATVTVDIPCPKCGRPMAIRTARTGVFLSCTGYELPKDERCKETINLVPGEEAESVEDSDESQEVNELRARERCPRCGIAMDSYLVDETRKLWVCGNSPDCPGTRVETGTFRIKGYDGPVIQCDKCGADMQLKTGRFGKYFGCTAYPECKNTRKLMRNGEPAPPKMDPIPMPELPCERSDAHFLLRDGAAGLFLAASTFPKSRETKSACVEDLARHRDELPEKYHYLADAPTTDPEGNPALVRFKRKERVHYLASEKDGKKTKWSAFYKDGQWEWSRPSPRKKKS
jgi:DNA topoisomerase-1